MDNQYAIEQTVLAVAPKVTVSAGVSSSAAFWFSQEIIGLIGLFIALCGFAVSWYYAAKKDRRQEKESVERLRVLREQVSSVDSIDELLHTIKVAKEKEQK